MQNLSASHGLHVSHVLALNGFVILCALALSHMANVWLRTSRRVPLVTGRKEEKLFIANNNFVIYSRCFRMKMNIAKAAKAAQDKIEAAQKELETAQDILYDVITKENKNLLEITNGVLNGIKEQFEEQEKKLTAEKEQLDVALEAQEEKGEAALKAQQKQAAKELQAQKIQAAAVLEEHKAALKEKIEEVQAEFTKQKEEFAAKLNKQEREGANALKAQKERMTILKAKEAVLSTEVNDLKRKNEEFCALLQENARALVDETVGRAQSEEGEVDSVIGQLKSIEEEELRGLEWQIRLRF